MGDAETRQRIGIWPWVAMVGSLVALGVRITVLLQHPGGDGRAPANLHPWIVWGGLPALALSVFALFASRRANQPQGTLVAGFVAFFTAIMMFISL